MRHCILLALSLFLYPTLARAHCEIPCGIYGDEGRFAALLEDVTTIEKSMNEINKLSDSPRRINPLPSLIEKSKNEIDKLSGKKINNDNQIVRWVINKEHHADHIRDVVAQYFFAQRITEPAADDAAAMKAYTDKLIALHKIIRTAMKCKQTTDPANAKALRELVLAFQALYNAE